MTLPLAAGERVGPYEILAPLGKGGMGEVYRARDSRLGRMVAIKVLARREAIGEGSKQRFIREARASSALNHPNIVAVYDVLAEQGVDFIVMEYVAGTSLDQLIARKRLSLSDALNYAIQIADGLAAAHAIGIVHRDIKPANLMITAEGVVKILDFGLAKHLEHRAPNEQDLTQTAGREALTKEASIVGTAAYMSPEQARGENVDRRSDVFSFGAVLYEVVTGRCAFAAPSAIATISAILKDEPEPVRRIRPDVPMDLERIIERCLRKDVSRRFQYLDDVKVELLEVKDKPDRAEPSAPGRNRRHAWLWSLVALVLLAGIWFTVTRNKSPESALTAVPLTTYPGSERFATFSPDGRQIAFSWNGEKQDNFDIYVKVIGTGAPLRITTDPAPDFYPAWSPDGRWIAFLRLLANNTAAVMLIPALGGPERKVADTKVYPSLAYALGVNPPRVAWLDDGNHLVIVDQASPVEPFALFLLTVDTGERRRLTMPPDSSFMDSGPAVSPDGQSVVFTRSNNNLGVGDLYLLLLSARAKPGEPKRLTFDNQQNGHPAWTADGRDIIFTSARSGGTLHLWRITASGSGTPQRLPSLGEDGLYPAVSRQGNRMVYTKYALDSNIWRVGPAQAQRAGSGATGIPLVSSTRQDVMPRFSPYGGKVAFASDRSGSYQIWVCDADGNNAVQLTGLAGVSLYPAWSPDGQRIVFSSNAEGHFQIYIVNASGGKPRPVATGREDGGWPSFSHDAKWIYFNSKRDGRDEVWKVPAEGGNAIQITRDGGYMAIESPDGAILYYMKRFSTGPLYRMSTAGGEETRVLEAIAARGYAVMGGGIYFVEPPQGTASAEYYEVNAHNMLEYFDFGKRKSETVAMLQKPLQLGLTVSPDGRSILYSQIDSLVEDLMLVENFR